MRKRSTGTLRFKEISYYTISDLYDSLECRFKRHS